jgi:hypothetical protein
MKLPFYKRRVSVNEVLERLGAMPAVPVARRALRVLNPYDVYPPVPYSPWHMGAVLGSANFARAFRNRQFWL